MEQSEIAFSPCVTEKAMDWLFLHPIAFIVKRQAMNARGVGKG
jgi:hypothetical protein